MFWCPKPLHPKYSVRCPLLKIQCIYSNKVRKNTLFIQCLSQVLILSHIQQIIIKCEGCQNWSIKVQPKKWGCYISISSFWNFFLCQGLCMKLLNSLFGTLLQMCIKTWYYKTLFTVTDEFIAILVSSYTSNTDKVWKHFTVTGLRLVMKHI